MTKQKDDQEKPLVNHRWQLPSLDDMLDDLLPEWQEGNHPDFSGADGYAKLRTGFRRFGESLMWQLSNVLEKAAGKGISQALALIQNPDYYETVKRRRTRITQRQKESHEQQVRDRERRARCEFTEEERMQELGRIRYDLNYHEKQIERLKARQRAVETSTPILAKTETNNQDDGDEWGDTIIFD